MHLTANLGYLLMIPLAILLPITVVVRVSHGALEVLFLDLPFFAAATFSVVFFYSASQAEQGRTRWERVKYLPLVMALGIGLSVNQARAVVEALMGYETGFTRTPKHGVKGSGESVARKRYKASATLQPDRRARARRVHDVRRVLPHRPRRLLLAPVRRAVPGRVRVRRPHERLRGHPRPRRPLGARPRSGAELRSRAPLNRPSRPLDSGPLRGPTLGVSGRAAHAGAARTRRPRGPASDRLEPNPLPEQARARVLVADRGAQRREAGERERVLERRDRLLAVAEPLARLAEEEQADVGAPGSG